VVGGGGAAVIVAGAVGGAVVIIAAVVAFALFRRAQRRGTGRGDIVDTDFTIDDPDSQTSGWSGALTGILNRDGENSFYSTLLPSVT
jgi:hypothetical protein